METKKLNLLIFLSLVIIALLVAIIVIFNPRPVEAPSALMGNFDNNSLSQPVPGDDAGDSLSTAPGENASSTTLANPASKYCSEQGGTLQIKKRADGAEFGLCYFDDNRACEEWAMFRGQCPIGGLKTTGYDNESQMYCAWLGGKVLAEPNAVCTLPNGQKCLAADLFQGMPCEMAGVNK